MDSVPAEIAHRHGYHAPKTQERIDRHEAVREMFTLASAVLADLLPSSREASLAQTAIQEAHLWAHNALSLYEDTYTSEQAE